MNETTVIIILVCMLMLLFSHLEKQKMQRTIDRLTDKVMAKDYREYTQLSKPAQTAERPTRKAQSWHDDPTIEIEDEDTN